MTSKSALDRDGPVTPGVVARFDLTLSGGSFAMLRFSMIPSLKLLVVAGSLTIVIGNTARSADTPPSGAVYVQSNVADSPGNQILGYLRSVTGVLTPLPGSPYSTGGAGISPSFNLGPYDSDQEIITNDAGNLLYATNGGSDSIAVFQFRKNGALMPIDGSPFSSGGSNPVSLQMTGNKLLVVNQANNPGHPARSTPNYTTLKVMGDGSLSTIKNAALPDDLGSNPTQILIPPTAPSVAFGCDFLGGILRSFQVADTGKLSLVDSQALPADEFGISGAPPLPLGLWTHPKHKILYVGFVTINRMGVYRFNNQGHFEFLRTVPNSGNGICWIRSNKAGTRLYTSNTVDPSISVYDTSMDPTEPIEIQRVVLKGMSNAYQISLDPTEKFLYCVSQRNSMGLPSTANALHVFHVAGDGMVSEVASSPTILPVPASSRPQGVLAF